MVDYSFDVWKMDFTTVQWWAVVRIKEYGWQESNDKISQSLVSRDWLHRMVYARHGRELMG
jgi:hypothetical protein